MLNNFFLLNFQFAVDVLLFLVLFASSWLHFDSWNIDKKKTSFMERGFGYFFLAASIFIKMIPLENNGLHFIAFYTDILGFYLIAFSLVREPISEKPKIKLLSFFPVLVLFTKYISFIPFILSVAIGLIYRQKVRVGLEKQLKLLYYVFFLLAVVKLYECLILSGLFSNNVIFDLLFSQYEIFWLATYLIKLIIIVVLTKWIWSYIRFRPEIQMFFMASASVFIIFISVTVVFTSLLFKNLENDTFSHLKTDINIFHFSLESLQTEALAYSLSLASDAEIIDGVNQKNSETIYQKIINKRINEKVSYVKVVNDKGEVILRTDDKNKSGENIYNTPTVKAALGGDRLSTIVNRQTSVFPHIEIQAASPIFDIKNKNTIGAVLIGYNIDNAFVDGVKKATDLDVSIFAGNQRSATTFFAPDGKTRYIGTYTKALQINQDVLKEGKVFYGAVSIINKPYYAVYSPLKTYGGKIIGMVSVGKSQNNLITTAKKSFDLTYGLSLIMMALSFIPSYFSTKFIVDNLKA
ncbi:MAG: cache domain-containing protein [Patescibacteria group bacterium]|jgi:hypothetical protein